MIETFYYFVMQKFGYRRYIQLDTFVSWKWRPKDAKGTYREWRYGWNYADYGADK